MKTRFELQVEAAAEKTAGLSEQLHESKSRLGELLLEAAKSLMPPGTLVSKADLGGKPWSWWSTTSGNDRGARTIEIVDVYSVSVDARHPWASKWNARAYAISPSTGKRMSGATGGRFRASKDDEIRVEGQLSIEPYTELRGAEWRDHCMKRFMAVIARAEDMRLDAQLEQAMKGD